MQEHSGLRSTYLFDRCTANAEKVIAMAHESAQRKGSNFITTGHLTEALFDESAQFLERLLKRSEELSSMRGSFENAVLPVESFHDYSPSRLKLSDECKRVLAYSMEEANRMGFRSMDVSHLIIGLLREEGEVAAILRKYDLTLESVRNAPRS